MLSHGPTQFHWAMQTLNAFGVVVGGLVVFDCPMSLPSIASCLADQARATRYLHEQQVKAHCHSTLCSPLLTLCDLLHRTHPDSPN